jgi:hypothetical protein
VTTLPAAPVNPSLGSPAVNPDDLTVEQVSKALPANLKGAATPAFVDLVNNIVSDPVVAEQVRNNFISYTKVLQEGKFKTEDYLHAVVFVSHRLMGMSQQDSYFKTFPQRYQTLVAKGTSSKDISAYVSAYARGKLVNLVMEQTLVPSWVLNQDIYQRAINTQAELMLSAQSELVRTQAANSILTHLAKPKETGPLVNIDMRETSGMNELKDMLTRLAQQQRSMIGQGVTTQEIASQKIIDVTPEEV